MSYETPFVKDENNGEVGVEVEIVERVGRGKVLDSNTWFWRLVYETCYTWVL